MSGIDLERCECGLELPRSDAPLPTHEYIGATAGCWALYTELLAKQYEGFGELTRIRALDAYCVQHHGKPERRAIQSVNVHLMALYLQLEKGYDVRQVNDAMQRVLHSTERFVWLEPPTPNGTLTVADILKGQISQGHADTIEAYARDIWRAWSVHRATIEKLALRAMGK